MANYRRSNNFLDDDVDDATFLRSSGGNTSGVDQRMKLLQERQAIEARTLASTQRSLQMLSDSEQIGSATAEELTRQREQLENTEQKLDEINASLRISERHIQSIKSVFGSIKNYFSNNKDQLPKSKPGTVTSPTEKADMPKSKSDLAQVLENSKQQQRRIIEEEEYGSFGASHSSASVMKHSPSVDEVLDRNLEDMSNVLGRLKNLGRNLGEEIDSQNDLVTRITDKAEDADFKMTKQSKDMNRILKK